MFKSNSMIVLFLFFFFFSSRRRHTRSDRDWSSDVCSSDLPVLRERRRQVARALSGGQQQMVAIGRALMAGPAPLVLDEPSLRPPPRPVPSLFARLRRIKPSGVARPPPALTTPRGPPPPPPA